MNSIKLFFIGVITLLSTSTLNAQVLISLILGDDLNSDKIEFGLIGGDNISFINTIPDAEMLNHFNLGFYFHINLKNNSYLSTGVLVKSSVGASGMPTYPIGDPEFDDVFNNGELTKKISYFYVPIMYHQRFNNRWYIEGGFQPGLRNKAYEIFEVDDEYGGELTYKKDARDNYIRLDFGLVGGVGYKFKKEIKSTAVGINYYQGLVDVSKVDNLVVKNSSVYFYVKIPIGAGKAEAKQTD